MTNWTVTWSMPINTRESNPLAASRVALSCMRDPGSIATWFQVTNDHTGELVLIDAEDGSIRTDPTITPDQRWDEIAKLLHRLDLLHSIGEHLPGTYDAVRRVEESLLRRMVHHLSEIDGQPIDGYISESAR